MLITTEPQGWRGSGYYQETVPEGTGEQHGNDHLVTRDVTPNAPGGEFLAAMSNSRSDVVTQFVRSLVMKEFFKLKQDVHGVLSSPEEFQLCFKKV